MKRFFLDYDISYIVLISLAIVTLVFIILLLAYTMYHLV